MSTIVDIRRFSEALKEYLERQFPVEIKDLNKEALFNFLKSKGYVFAECKEKCGQYSRPSGQSCCEHWDPELEKCFLLDDLEG